MDTRYTGRMVHRLLHLMIQASWLRWQRLHRLTRLRLWTRLLLLRQAFTMSSLMRLRRDISESFVSFLFILRSSRLWQRISRLFTHHSTAQDFALYRECLRIWALRMYTLSQARQCLTAISLHVLIQILRILMHGSLHLSWQRKRMLILF